MQALSIERDKNARRKQRVLLLRMETIREWLAGLAWSG